MNAEDFVAPALVTLEEPPAERRACIEFLLDLATAAGRVTDREAARDALLEREAASPTGLGNGVALPHARTDAVARPTVAFARSERGVDFGAPDGDPATLLFCLLAPADAAADHLEALSRLSRALADPTFRSRLAEADSERAVVAAIREAVA
ncbi:PTS sugar transporter subunit IIA [Halorussus gelatinilyticus]|uniref:PTS sugar transporter subunit IIA n=1 Tax=Halorussus gelatinilyticus TaxID=2937524 RepID=A0A8U0IKJ5_9EURY|nr:PTS sugar transporter subunit IIA [Halorussus gelatinilyticus]UPW01196.1 PTS sugar transporter subunit IIA [Halorussus gelatinilyticus]